MDADPPQSRITHLIKLMDDRDEFVRTRVRDQLIELGEDALPFLEIAAKDEKLPVRNAAQQIIREIFPRQLAAKFHELSVSGPGDALDLESGTMLLVQYGYPETNTDALGQALDELAEELGNRLSPKDSPQEVVEKLTLFLFREKGFSGNKKKFFDPDNSYFNKVLERKTGIPITLSALCLFIAKRLDLPIVGVGLPGHYIVKYDSPRDAVYFDPFNKGRILVREECIGLVNRLGYHFEDHYLAGITHRETLIRMLNNLVTVYGQTKEEEKVRHLTEYIKILTGTQSGHPSKSL